MITLEFHSNVRLGMRLIIDGEAYPIMDHAGTRYLISTHLNYLGTLVFTPFSLSTQEAEGFSYHYLYGMQTTFREAILGPGPRTQIQAIVTEFPTHPTVFPTPGQVIPGFM